MTHDIAKTDNYSVYRRLGNKHIYCLAIEAGFYSDMVECLPVDTATWVQFSPGTG